MLDFLPEKIRGVLLEYPLIVDFLNGKIKEGLFLKDLKAFRGELISKGVPLIYVDNFGLLALVETIRNEAGFIVHVHSGGRGELNDIPAGVRLPSRWQYNLYTRCFYRIKLQKENWIYTGDEIEIATCLAFGDIPKEGYAVPGYNDDFDVVTFGVLPVLREVSYTKTESVKKPFWKGGALGKTEDKQYRASKTVYGAPLNEIIESANNSSACYVRFTIRTKISDDAGRRTHWPHLIIVCDNALKERIITNNLYSELYDPFINLLVDRTSFPNVNKGILDKRKVPGDKIIFFETDKMWGNRKPRQGVNKKLLPWVIDKYGAIVQRR
jgi:hypothetical protein